MNARAECTVVVCSCDRYADLLRPFCELWRRFWPDCPFDLALVTESDPGEGLCFDKTIACGKGGNWCSRLVTALSKIETPYVLLLCDDYYLEKPVDTALVLRRLGDIRRLDALNLRLIPNPTPKPSNSAPLGDGTGLLRYRHSTAYCIATQAGIWKREMLSKLAAGKSSIWEFERYGSFDPTAAEKPILVVPAKEFPFVDAVHKGYWERFGLDVCARNGIDLGGTKRTLPPISTRIVEGLKAVAFRILPTDLLVRFQNRFSLGAKEPRSAPSASR